MSLDFTDAQFDSLTQELKKRLGLIELFARLGDADDLSIAVVDEPGRKGYVRVRLQNDDVPYRVVKSGVLGGYNPDPGTSVILHYDTKGELAIKSVDFDGIVEAGGNPLIYNSGDRRMSAFTATDGLRPLLTGAVSGNAGTTTNEIFIDKFRFAHNNTVKEFAGATVDLSSLVPTAGNHRYVGVFLRITDLVIELVGSTPKATITPLTDTDKQECFDGRSDLTMPVALWRLADAQTKVTGDDQVEDLRPWLSSLSTESGAINLEYLKFVLNPTSVPNEEGIVSWNSDDLTINVNTGLGPVWQGGQELFTLVYNGTGSQIDNGTAVYPIGAVGGRPSVAEALADTHVTFAGILLVTTMNIPHDTVGIVARDVGKVRGLDTSGFSAGDTLWLAATGGGILNNLTNVKPSLPDYQVQIGGVDTVDAVDGIIELAVKADATDTVLNFWNGVFREPFDFLVTSNGSTITGTITPTNGHPDMTMIFSDGFSILDTSPGATITLTAGANDQTPQKNFVYIPQTTKVLTLSTSGFPTDIQHIRVAEVLCITAATTQLEGSARRNQNWNDEIATTSTEQGHLAHIGEWIRAQPASYVKNTGDATAATLTGTTANVYIASNPGDVLQFHRGTFPAQDMTQYTIDAVSTGSKTFTISGDGDLTTTFYVGKIIHVHNSTGNDGAYTVASVNWSDPDFIITVEEAIPSAVADGTIGDFIIVINDPATALRKSINLNDMTVATDSSTLNNRWFNIVIWGVRNKAGELSYMMCNLPSSNSYLSEVNAIDDASNETVYTIPDDYAGVGFLIARFTLRKSGASFTYNGGSAFVDLRGQFPSTAAGGGGGGAGGGTMSSFTIAADSGTPETIVDGDAITHTGGIGMDTVVSATDTITYNASIDAAGQSGGQTLIGGTDAGDDLTLQSTSNATKGNIDFGTTMTIDEVNGLVGIGVTPTYVLDIQETGAARLRFANPTNSAGNKADIVLSVAGTSAGDPGIIYQVTGSAQWMTGIDTSDSRKWKLTRAATLGFAGRDVIEVDTSQNVKITSNATFALGTGTSVNEFSTDGTLAGDSDDAVPTEKAVKTYVDASGGGVDVSTLSGGNLWRNFPSIELADGAKPVWVDETGDGTLTEEGATGEAIPQNHGERVLKMVASADNASTPDNIYQEFRSNNNTIITEYVERSLDDNVSKISCSCWVYTATAGTVTLELYDAGATSSIATDITATTSTWVYLSIENQTFQDRTQMRIRHSANSATFYVAQPQINEGTTVMAWSIRGYKFHEKKETHVLNENPADTNWADLDFNSITSAQTMALSLVFAIGSNNNAGGYVRRNGDTLGLVFANLVAFANVAGDILGSISNFTICDEVQIIEEAVNSANVSVWSISMNGYWEWES